VPDWRTKASTTVIFLPRDNEAAIHGSSQASFKQTRIGAPISLYIYIDGVGYRIGPPSELIS
jgi:hypothetical protein